MTGAIHFVPWPKPTHVNNFGFFILPSFPPARRFGYPWIVHLLLDFDPMKNA